ncbi:hypothetical protein P154DRAFT_504050 [Amniculicola lignicola CBS 123094]|uniref:Impact N-terminal domain-containing protein n=1 Tax=Amniculicola lignicola CBS 123094 TaxID=1392246 RepID=A0A6A5VW18_9PLEO|nr:hypothetical protein P154DRAFT_504050 [Amniculicola lignicola CBS 123094]
MSKRRQRSPSPPSDLKVFHASAPIEDRGSIFWGAFSPTLPVSTLKKLPEHREAEYHMTAWRSPSNQRSLVPGRIIYISGGGDGGERGGGARLKKVLEDMQVEGSVVVARKYGGSNLGPVRFTHIESCAKDAIKRPTTPTREMGPPTGLLSPRSEETTRKALAEMLRERDDRIAMFRKMLTDKEAQLKDEAPVPPSPQKNLDYDSMSVAKLRKVEEGKDRTMKFILDRLNKVDDELEAIRKLEENMVDIGQAGKVETAEGAGR